MSLRLSRLAALPLLTVVALAVPVAVGQLRVQPDQNHVVASRLEGVWVADAELCKRLGSRSGNGHVEFRSDPAVLDALPPKLTSAMEKSLGEFRIWMAGTVTFVEGERTMRGPFLLTTHTGNTSVVFFRSVEGQELDDAESGIVALAPARDRKNDILFMGGDFNNEPFRALRRAEEAPK